MTARLTYCNGRGRGEVVRYVMGAAGIEFTEEFLTCPEDLERVRTSGKSIFRQVPLLEINGLAITQTEAMIRYIARNYDLYGSSEEERIRCDMIYDGLKDAAIGNSGLGMEFKGEHDKLKAKGIMKEKVTKYFPMFERLISKPENFFVGDKLSFVDVVFLHELEWLTDCFNDSILDSYPVIKAYRDRLQQLPTIKAFLASPQKKPYPDAEYVAGVMKVFYS